MPHYYSYTEGDTSKLLMEMFPPDYKGVYVDVGAGLPEEWSNSLAFRKKGWKIIAIEPQPAMCAEFRKRGYEVLQYSCAATDIGETDFQILDHHYGLSSSSFQIVYNIDPKAKITPVRVQAYTLNTLLQRFHPEVTHIDILDIDVERYELQVLQGFDAAKYRPTVMVIENPSYTLNYNNPNEFAIREHYAKIGYRIIGNASWNEFVAPIGSELDRKANCATDEEAFMAGFNEPPNESAMQWQIWDNYLAHVKAWGGMEHDPHDHCDELYNIPYVRAGLELFQQHVAPDAESVLELGCAQAYILNHVGGPNTRRVGIDFNEDRVHKGRAKYPNTQFIVGDARTLDWGGLYDYVLLPGILEHVRLQEAHALIKHSLAVCKPGGKVLFDLPWWNGNNQDFNTGIHMNPCHAWVGTRARFDWLFRGMDAHLTILPEHPFYAFGVVEKPA